MKRYILLIFFVLIILINPACSQVKIQENKNEPSKMPQKLSDESLYMEGEDITGVTPAPSDKPSTGDSVNAGTIQTEKSKNVSILMYHAIDETPWGLEQLFVRTSDFEKQMKFLAENGYTQLSFDDLENFEAYKKPVIISFDDGYSDNFYNAYPILKRFNHKATIFIIADNLGKPKFLSVEQVKSMTDIISFQSHTFYHNELDKVSEESIRNDCIASKKFIEDITGKPVNTLSYPVGRYNQKVIDVISNYYKYAVTTEPGVYRKGDDNYRIKRIRIQRSDTLNSFAAKLQQE